MNIRSPAAGAGAKFSFGKLATAIALACAMTAGVQAQKVFNTPEEAMNAFGDAIQHDSEDTLRTVFGKDFRDLIPRLETKDRETFISAWRLSHGVAPAGDGRAHIYVGDAGWTFPVPLVKTDNGWHFDTRAGAEEMRLRRIGRNELAVIQTMLAVYDAQREYAQTTHDGTKLLVYASKLISSPGKHDGLYWPTGAGQAPSPLGPAFVDAASRNPQDEGFEGYRFKLLTSQGKNAPGGAYNYVVQGKLFGGFAVVAWPVRYGDTGIKTFMVSHAGQVYQRDLGPDSAAKSEAMKQFDPGPGWSKVPLEDTQ